ncbi:hypothetical protein FRC09_015101, partial [Ceratobasidium sp. 395]
YLIVETTHNNRLYELKIETLGKVDRSRLVIQALGLTGLRAGALGDAKFQVEVVEVTGGSSAADFVDHEFPANLITSMGGVDDPLFRSFETFAAADSDDWYFTSVVPPNLSKVDIRDSPTLGHLCRVLSSVLNRAPNYTIEAHNCYFLCHMVMLGLLELCAPLPRLTWTLHALHRPVDLDTKIPWHRRMRGRTSRFFRDDSAIIYVRGSPSDHLRAIIIDGWGLGGVSSFYQGIQIHVYIIILSIFALVPPIVCGAIWKRKKLWIWCTIALAVVVAVCILGRLLADRRWLRTLIQLGEVENLIMRDI